MKNKAFTLIESVLAITFVTLVITAIAGVVMVSIQANARNVHQLQALALAEEALEAMRYIRDSNWMQNYAWNGGAQLWGDDFALNEGEERTLYLEEVACPSCWALGQDGSVQVGTEGKTFERSILASYVDENTVELTAIVEWNERGQERSLELSTYLSDWK